mgnify:CR=1 FL=1
MKVRLLATLLAAASAVPAAAQGDALWQSFVDPPADARPMMRWWWFGPSVDNAEIDREIAAMKAGGFGGFEVQPVYPLSPDDPAKGIRNLPYLSDDFIAALRHAGETARAQGMRIDVTGGSGWPFGGPHIPVTQAAANIRMIKVAVPAGATEVVMPALGAGESFISAVIGAAGATGGFDTLKTDAPRVSVEGSTTAREALVFVAGRTGQQVKRAAVASEGYVLDHIDPAAVQNHLTTVGDRLLDAFEGAPPPYAIFSDSLEAYGSSWTGDLPAEFRRRRGYDLTDHLPALFLDTPDSAAVRFDWARTLSELVDERYLKVIDDWAKARGTRFRAQVYGFPPPTLSSNALVALPEGEGADWRGFNSTRWATSGAHLYGKPVVSSEVWTWLRSPSWAATPLDMKVEADRHFLQGITQLVGHGWPYTPQGVEEPGWAFYAAAALNDHNPWYPVMPDVTRYLQRVSHMLRQGEPANGVAIYLPIEDAFAGMRPQRASVNEAMHDRVPNALVEQVMDAGHGFDFIDAGAVNAGKLKHRVLVLPPMQRIDPDAYAAIAEWVKKGGKVVAVGGLPTTAGGLKDDKARAQVARLSRELDRRKWVRQVDQAQVGNAILAAAPADMTLASPDPAIGFIRRKVEGGDLYFLANTGNTAVKTRARFAGDRGNGRWWDPVTGRQWGAGSGDIALELAPYESRLLTFVGQAAPAHVAATAIPRSLDARWTMRIGGKVTPVEAFASWADLPATRYFSGTAIYSVAVDLDPLAPGRCLALDFGETTPVATTRANRPVGAIEAPIRDAAIVRVNGERVGSVWATPYRVDLTAALKPGSNRIDVEVSNTNMNMLAGRAPADHRLLHGRYGERFQPQDLDKISAQPSGILKAPRLIEAGRTEAPCGT